MSAPTLLRADHIAMHFGGLRALDDVSIEVKARQVVGLIGPNGSGKSTFINVLTRLYEPTAGEVRFGDALVSAVPPHAVAALGITRTFQNVRLFATMSVRDNLAVGAVSSTRLGIVGAGLATPGGRREEQDVASRVAQVSALLGLDHVLDRVAGDLPYGLQKLVELGRALMPNPRMVLLDEPVAGMNPSEKQALIAALASVRQAREVAFLVVEHDMQFVMQLTEYLYVLNFGKVIAQGTPQAVRADPGVIEAYLGGTADAVH